MYSRYEESFGLRGRGTGTVGGKYKKDLEGVGGKSTRDR